MNYDLELEDAKQLPDDIRDLQIQFLQEHKKQDQINAKKERMAQLSEDFIQATIGEIIPNLADKKAEFIRLHNEVRVLEGKLPREVKSI